MWLHTTVKVLDGLSSAATIVALIAGLWWFIFRRSLAKKLVTEHEVCFIKLKDEVYVGVTVTIKNLGNVKIKDISPVGNKSVMIIEELSPYLDGKKVSQEKSPEYILNFLGSRTFPKLLELEPGETQKILFEFIVQKLTKAIKVYSYLDNPKAKGVGWDRTTIHEVNI